MPLLSSIPTSSTLPLEHPTKNITKRIASIVLSLVMLFSIFSVVSADANEPEVKFEPQLVNEYYNNEGYLVSEFSDLPDNFVTDSEGNILKENAPTLRNGCALRYSYKTIKTEKIKNDKFISNHPGFKEWDKVDGYYFSSKNSNYSVGLSGFGVSVSASVGASGTGRFISASAKKWSRPAIYGDAYKTTKTVTVTNPCGANKKYNKNYYTTKKTYNKAIYK